MPCTLLVIFIAANKGTQSIASACPSLLSVSIHARSLVAWVLLTGVSLCLSLSCTNMGGFTCREDVGGKVTMTGPRAITATSVRGSRCDDTPQVYSEENSPGSVAGPTPCLPGGCQAQVPGWRCSASSDVQLPFHLFTCSPVFTYKRRHCEKSFSSYLLKFAIPFLPLLMLV